MGCKTCVKKNEKEKHQIMVGYTLVMAFVCAGMAISSGYLYAGGAVFISGLALGAGLIGGLSYLLEAFFLYDKYIKKYEVKDE